MVHTLGSLILAIGLLVIFPADLHAAATDFGPFGRTVSGSVTDAGGNPVSGAQVIVTCMGNTLNGSTTTVGQYNVQFDQMLHCMMSEPVNVSVIHGSQSGSSTKPMGILNVTIPVQLTGAASVPEFGMISGAVTIIGSAAAFLMIKLRNKHL